MDLTADKYQCLWYQNTQDVYKHMIKKIKDCDENTGTVITQGLFTLTQRLDTSILVDNKPLENFFESLEAEELVWNEQISEAFLRLTPEMLCDADLVKYSSMETAVSCFEFLLGQLASNEAFGESESSTICFKMLSYQINKFGKSLPRRMIETLKSIESVQPSLLAIGCIVSFLSTPGHKQADFCVQLLKSCSEHIRMLTIKELSKASVPWPEETLSVLHFLINQSYSSTTWLDSFFVGLAMKSDAFLDNVKFAKLLSLTITRFHEQMNAEAGTICRTITNNHTSFMKDSLNNLINKHVNSI